MLTGFFIHQRMNMNRALPANPVISIIIPCYNHGNYLEEALESIFSQQYEAVEIVVVDDGSTDNTKAVAEQYKRVKYIYQDNKGLSAARNTGIKNCSGDFLVFLDADDWLLPGALKTNLAFFKSHPDVAFVSGGFKSVYTDSGKSIDTTYEVTSAHYINFLRNNFIGMHAAVMYQRWVFDEFYFDETLLVCEDYDLYLKISKKYPVYHHTHIIAAYRKHNSNMSSDIPKMLSGVLSVLKTQKKDLRNISEKGAYSSGRKIWKEYYSKELYDELKENKRTATRSELLTLVKYDPLLATKYFLRNFLK